MTDDDLRRALDANFAVHASWLAARRRGAYVRDDPSLLLVDSGLHSDTFNVVCRTRLASVDAACAVRNTVRHFADVGRPFSWWVGPLDEPAGLEDVLAGAGLSADECELAMAAEIDNLVEPDLPAELRVDVARTPAQVAEFASVVAANWDPPDPAVVSFYEDAAPLLAPDAPIRLYVGSVAGRAVAAAELCLGGGVAGLYGVATLRAYRKRGYGGALTLAPLIDAGRAGVRAAVLQASEDGRRVYERLGFRAIGAYREYKP